MGGVERGPRLRSRAVQEPQGSPSPAVVCPAQKAWALACPFEPAPSPFPRGAASVPRLLCVPRPSAPRACARRRPSSESAGL